jgi:uncharacterized protein with GYD domain
MPTFIVLTNWTDQGIKAFEDSPSRADAGMEEMAKLGVTRREMFWTVGPYDEVLVCDAPDIESMTAAVLRMGAAGNVRTTTLRAFTRDEFDQLAQRAR